MAWRLKATTLPEDPGSDALFLALRAPSIQVVCRHTGRKSIYKINKHSERERDADVDLSSSVSHPVLSHSCSSVSDRIICVKRRKERKEVRNGRRGTHTEGRAGE